MRYEQSRDALTGHRFVHVFSYPHVQDQFAVEADAGIFADHQHLDVRCADTGKALQLVCRICHLRDVHNECPRRRLPGQMLDGVQDRSAPDIDAFNGIDEPAMERGLGLVIGHEGQKWRPCVRGVSDRLPDHRFGGSLGEDRSRVKGVKVGHWPGPVMA